MSALPEICAGIKSLPGTIDVWTREIVHLEGGDRAVFTHQVTDCHTVSPPSVASDPIVYLPEPGASLLVAGALLLWLLGRRLAKLSHPSRSNGESPCRAAF